MIAFPLTLKLGLAGPLAFMAHHSLPQPPPPPPGVAVVATPSPRGIAGPGVTASLVAVPPVPATTTTTTAPPLPPGITTSTTLECVVTAYEAPYPPATYSAGPADANGTCGAYSVPVAGDTVAPEPYTVTGP